MSGDLVTAYASQMRQLMPQGAAWDFAPDSIAVQLLTGLSDEFARVDIRAATLVEESDPRTTLELLPDWERVAGLPDSCFGAPDNVAERQVALTQKITSTGGQSRAYFIGIAAELGYYTTIEEHRPARMGMRLGERLKGPEWAFAWTMHIEPFDGDLPNDQFFLANARLGDRLGVRLQGYGAIDLECLIRRNAPAHTIVLFAYDIQPDALFWIDFTS